MWGPKTERKRRIKKKRAVIQKKKKGLGFPKWSPPPSQRKDWYSSPKIEIGRPWVIIRAKLLAIARVASVGTKGDIFSRVMQSPFRSPMPEAPSRLIRMARGTGQ